MASLKAPYPWFGGKSRAAPLIWERIGDVPNYVEPFFGSGAVLLGRPREPGIETVNDIDGLVCNAWRAIAQCPDETWEWADQPVNECDLHARHVWLRGQITDLTERLMGDPEFCDPRIAGWWLWGIACWIGGGWCGPSGAGPWIVRDGRFVKSDAGMGVTRKLPHLGDAGKGVKRQLPHLGSAGMGVTRQLPHLGDAGMGVTRRRLDMGFRGVTQKSAGVEWFRALAARLRRVRVCCGDWTRVMGPTPTIKHGLTGIVLDPPYSHDAGRDLNVYVHDHRGIAEAVREWCVANGDNPLLRIALCGYDTEHGELEDRGWTVGAWQAHGGYSARNPSNQNKHRERVWFSPHCLPPPSALL